MLLSPSARNELVDGESDKQNAVISQPEKTHLDKNDFVLLSIPSMFPWLLLV
jgi:hypothetical protein